MLRFIGLCLVLYAFTFQADQKSFFDYLQQNKVTDLTIISNYIWLTKNKFIDTTLDCRIQWMVDGKEMSLKGDLTLRGKTRRRICDYPPIKINLSKKGLKEIGLNQAVDEYKIVQPCKNAENGEDLLQRELLAYQLIQLIDSHSFKTHQFNLKLKNENGTGLIQHAAFMMESEEEIGLRLKLEPLDGMKNDFKITSENHLRLALIQLFVGNDDWDVNAQRNVFLLKDTTEQIVPIAYDFDYSGLVAANYARPNPNLPPHLLRDRVYMGPKVDEALWSRVKAEFLGQRDQILDYLKNTEIVKTDTRRDITTFIKAFFADIKNNKPPLPNTVYRYAIE